MLSWTDRKRFAYFLCLFPSLMMLLLQTHSMFFDFLLLFAIFSTVFFAVLSVLLQPSISYYWLMVTGFFTIVLRMMLVGAAVRKIGLTGPDFDGQIIRKITDIFYYQTMEANLTIAVIAYITLRFLAISTITKVANDIQVQIHVRSELNFVDLGAKNESASGSNPGVDFRESSRVPLFFLNTAKIEFLILPLLMVLAVVLSIWNRDRFTPDSIEKAIKTSALLVLSTVLCLLPGLLLNLFAIREWLSQLAAKRVAKLNLRELLFENRKKAMVFGSFCIILSFLPDFPSTFLVLLGGSMFAGGFLSDVVETINTSHLEIQDGLVPLEEKAIERENRIKLQFGRTLWNNYFVGNEASMIAALNLSRMKVIQETGIIIEEIPIEFNSRLHPESVAILINNRRISASSFEIQEEYPIDNLQRPNISPIEVMTEMISDAVCRGLSDQVALLSHDPALDHLVREFEFKS